MVCYFLIPLSFVIENPLETNATLNSTLSLIYLGVVATGGAWLLRFKILTEHGSYFQVKLLI